MIAKSYTFGKQQGLIITRSTLASLLFKGLADKQSSVKWSIGNLGMNHWNKMTVDTKWLDTTSWGLLSDLQHDCQQLKTTVVYCLSDMSPISWSAFDHDTLRDVNPKLMSVVSFIYLKKIYNNCALHLIMKIPANWVGLVWSGRLYSFHHWFCGICLTFYNLNSSCIFSILFSIHFLRCWRGEFV